MNELFQFLTWDSQFFGLKVVRILLPAAEPGVLASLLQNLTQQEVQLAYWFIAPHDEVSNQAALSHQGLLVDKKITYARQLPLETFPVSPFVHLYTETDPTKELIELSLISGQYSRFKVDPHLSPEDFARLYREWMVNSTQKKIADQVWVYEKNDTMMGMVTLGKKGMIGQIGLLAVHPAYWGQSIGQSLIRCAFEQFNRWGIRSIEVVTQQANQRASRFYEHCGFRMDNFEHVYHFWL